MKNRHRVSQVVSYLLTSGRRKILKQGVRRIAANIAKLPELLTR
jgi:hypothetical protein